MKIKAIGQTSREVWSGMLRGQQASQEKYLKRQKGLCGI